MENNDTKERILHVAEKYFASEGFYGTSISKLARGVGITKSSVLHHFSTKEQLYGTVLKKIAHSLEEMTFPILAQEELSHVERIRRLLDAYVEWVNDNVDGAQILLRELLDNRQRAHAVDHWYLAPVLNGVAEMIAEGQERGVFKSYDPMLFWIHMLGSLNYFYAALPTTTGILSVDSESIATAYHRQLQRILTETLLVESPTE